ncbi:hypothetical protein [Polaromonas jejuensis]|uniref:Uncharacterized protein n=1 Tax=Polaromonas jejuensis TaxID=457502 RepID=A0ABW0Q535_9BURK|nr:hypothetical protein [Polaromonas jejuensis]
MALLAGKWSHVLSRTEPRSGPIYANTEGHGGFAEYLDKWLREMEFVAQGFSASGGPRQALPVWLAPQNAMFSIA